MMPIRPENRDRYPADWKDISLRIRKRARWQCECKGECGKPHPRGRCELGQGDRIGDCGKVVLTVAHLDHQPENCCDENLRAMCQGCHLRYDVDHHRETRARTRRAAEIQAGQGMLWEVDA